jgi:hypothetical protein
MTKADMDHVNSGGRNAAYLAPQATMSRRRTGGRPGLPRPELPQVDLPVTRSTAVTLGHQVVLRPMLGVACDFDSAIGSTGELQRRFPRAPTGSIGGTGHVWIRCRLALAHHAPLRPTLDAGEVRAETCAADGAAPAGSRAPPRRRCAGLHRLD